MTTDTGEMSCETKSWAASAAAGLLVFLVSIWLFGWGFFISLVLGVVVLVGLGIFVTRNYCSDSATGGFGPAATAPQSQPRTETEHSTASTASQPTGVVAPAAEPEPEPEPERDRTPEVPLTATPAADEAARAPASEAAPEDTTGSGSDADKPELLASPRGQADDLKAIKGVGPKLEVRLNALGVFHYGQIAAWSREEADWVDLELDLRGRIARDGWVEQARRLAAGGAQEG